MNKPESQQANNGMSYKFQRLREKIREAVTSGEYTGKLPGERELAKRFHVNAKTLSKALTDLAAEGLLQRSIGRGTFVKGSEPAEQSTGGPWLLITDRGETHSPVIRALKELHPEQQIIDDVASLRPSFLNQFTAVVDFSTNTPETFMRDLMVRNMPLVAVDREPRTYSTNGVRMDSMLGIAELTRDLALAGHRQFLAIDTHNRGSISESIRKSLPRYAADASVDSCFPRDILCALEYGATAAICDSVQSALEILAILENAQISVPNRVSVSAIGCLDGDAPCTGYFVPARQKAQAVCELLAQPLIGPPTTLWLTGNLIDRHTTSPLDPMIEQQIKPAVLKFNTLAV